MWPSILLSALAALAQSSVAASTSPELLVGPHVITNPDWIRRPSPADLSAVWPADAARAGIGGRARIKCTVATTGVLRDCSVLEETPPGSHFGAAGLALIPQFRMKPLMMDGVATNFGQVVIPINWRGSGVSMPNDHVTQIMPQHAAWTTAPTDEQVKAAYPTQARGKRSGSGVARCMVAPSGRLYDCNPLGPDPDGFAHAATRLMHDFTMATTLIDGSKTNGAAVDVPVAFEMSEAAGSRIPRHPVWLHSPTVGEAQALYPAAAKAQGLAKVSVVESCTVAPGGWLTGCVLKGESPVPGAAEAGALLASKFQMTVWSSDGFPTIGARINLPIVWNAPEDDPPPAAKP